MDMTHRYVSMHPYVEQFGEERRFNGQRCKVVQADTDGSVLIEFPNGGRLGIAEEELTPLDPLELLGELS